MTKNILVAALVAFALNLSAQVTITKNHMVTVGKKMTTGTDYTTRKLPSSGANQTWNFSNLSADEVDSARVGVAGWFPGHANFPKANLALVYYSSHDSDINFLDINDTSLMSYGNYSLTDSGEVVTPLTFRLLSFPSTYQTTFTDVSKLPPMTFPIGFDPDSAGPIPFVDSIQMVITFNSKSNIDGWGSMTTPLGTYSALKQTIQRIATPSVKMFSGGIGINVPLSLLSGFFGGGGGPSVDTSYTVNFWTNDASVGFPIVTYDYSQGDDSTMYMDWQMSKAQSSSVNPLFVNAAFAYPNPVKQMLTIESPVATSRLSLYNMKGQLVLDQELQGNEQVSVQHLANGLYIAQLVDVQSGQVIRLQKIAKQ